MKILGFNYDLFISSMCCLGNNNILFASPEERFSREKNSRKFPHLALDYYLKKKK